MTSQESRYLLRLSLCGPKPSQPLLLKLIVNIEECPDIDSLIGQICVKLGIPHVD